MPVPVYIGKLGDFDYVYFVIACKGFLKKVSMPLDRFEVMLFQLSEFVFGMFRGHDKAILLEITSYSYTEKCHYFPN